VIAPPTRPTDCPDLETLAAFVDGRLATAERDVVVRHLADCDACREVVAESSALAAALATEDRVAGDPTPLREARVRGSRAPLLAATAAAALALVSLSWWFGLSRSREERALAELGRPELAARLPATWAEPVWPVLRSASPRLPGSVAAFRAGVRHVDLPVALARGQSELGARFAREIAHQLRSTPFADAAALEMESFAKELEIAPPSRAESIERARRLDESSARLLDPEWLALGRWAEGGRLLALAGDSRRWDRPPGSWLEEPEIRSAMDEAVAAPPDRRAAAFARLIEIAARERPDD
jgi:hypothetical protein